MITTIPAIHNTKPITTKKVCSWLPDSTKNEPENPRTAVTIPARRCSYTRRMNLAML